MLLIGVGGNIYDDYLGQPHLDFVLVNPGFHFFILNYAVLWSTFGQSWTQNLKPLMILQNIRDLTACYLREAEWKAYVR